MPSPRTGEADNSGEREHEIEDVRWSASWCDVREDGGESEVFEDRSGEVRVRNERDHAKRMYGAGRQSNQITEPGTTHPPSTSATAW